jgi:cytidine deaminase
MMTNEQQSLLDHAIEAVQFAHAPYSGFNVGAAVLTPGGIYTGANIENACTNLGTCAERVAIAHARMNGQTTILGIAVYCGNAPEDSAEKIRIEHTMPCGGCRQWMAELAPNAWLITNGSDQVFVLKDLLPHPFLLTKSIQR